MTEKKGKKPSSLIGLLDLEIENKEADILVIYLRQTQYNHLRFFLFWIIFVSFKSTIRDSTNIFLFTMAHENRQREGNLTELFRPL
jgi:hypothetical protein